MFDFDETDLFHRCGYDKRLINNNEKTYFTGRYYTLNDGTTIPVMHYPIISGCLTRHLVLKTHLGYIPVEKIKRFSDIFIKSNYLDDDTEWILPYLFQQTDKYEELVNNLSKVLGKHWKNYPDNKEIKPKTRVLIKKD